MSTTTTVTVTETIAATTSKTSGARVSLSPCTMNNVGTVRKLNSVLFPVRYAERFYGYVRVRCPHVVSLDASRAPDVLNLSAPARIL